MSSYILPRLTVYQEFIQVLGGNTLPLNACIVAPHYGLHRYDNEDERACYQSGGQPVEYDPTQTNNLAGYPDKHAGSVIDLDTLQVKLSEAVLQYFNNVIPAGVNSGLLSDDGNKIRSASYIWKTANGFDRSAIFGNRDVKVGDYCKVMWGSQSIVTTIAGLIADEIAAVVGNTQEASGNTPAQAALIESLISANLSSPKLSITDIDASSYDGLADGAVNDTYVCTVVQTDGTLEGTHIRVTSQSGKDNVADQVLSASGVATPLGTRGATFTMENAGTQSSSSESMSMSESESSEGYDGEAPKVGDSWTIKVGQVYSKPTLNSSGTYTGEEDTQYVVRILQGGVVGTDTIIFDVYTVNGYDSKAAIEVTAAGDQYVGNHGVKVTFNSGDQFVAGDEFIIAVTAESKGAVRTLALAENLTGAKTTDDLTVILGLEDDITLDEDYWSADQSGISIQASLQHAGDYLGLGTSLFNVLAGEICVDYRELLKTFSTAMGALENAGDVEDILGPPCEANPLALLVYKALQNSNGVSVYYVALAENSLQGYLDAFDIISNAAEPYSIVPYSMDASVIQATKTHVLDMSSPNNGLWRIAWVSEDVKRDKARYTQLANGNDILATISDAGGGQYLQVDASGALFITNGVEAGDKFRINFSTDAFGNTTYDEYVVDTVNSEERLTLVAGPSAAIGVPVKCEIWETSTLSEFSQDIGLASAQLGDRRVYNIWCEKLYDADTGEVVSRSALCAALAGLRSAVAPHQPLTNVEVAGFSLVTETGFSMQQLNVMAGQGTWIVVQDLEGNVYTRHQLSTDNTDVLRAEQTITTNLDHISRDLKDAMSDLYGRGNVSQQMIELIRSRINTKANEIGSRDYPATIGPQVQELEIAKIEIDEVQRSAIDVYIDPVLPIPLNNLNLHIRVS